MISKIIKSMVLGVALFLLQSFSLPSLSNANDIHSDPTKSLTSEIDSKRTFTENLNVLKTGDRLSDDFILHYLGSNPNVPMSGYVKWYFDGILRERQDSVFIIVKTEQPEGMGRSLYSFTKSGERVESRPILTESKICDSGISAPSFSYGLVDDIIEIKEKRQICNTDILSSISVKYYKMADNGQLLYLEKHVNTKSRKYPELSNMILSEDALKPFSTDELSLMRNEIFASHGFIFKSSDLDKYFTNQEWYRPRSRDVSSALSTIEKQNIELIKQFEKYN